MRRGGRLRKLRPDDSITSGGKVTLQTESMKTNNPNDGGDTLISRGEEPLNLEMPFSTLDAFITPNERFYVRCHFPIPQLDPDNWRLKVEGAVGSPLELTYDELRQMPKHTIMATMECAGNGRSFLQPKVKGVAWDLGAVGNAEWTGVLLRDVLEKAGVNARRARSHPGRSGQRRNKGSRRDLRARSITRAAFRWRRRGRMSYSPMISTVNR